MVSTLYLIHCWMKTEIAVSIGHRRKKKWPGKNDSDRAVRKCTFAETCDVVVVVGDGGACPADNETSEHAMILFRLERGLTARTATSSP